MVYCAYEDQEKDCSLLFEEESTDGGFCCSFNSIVIIHRDKVKNNNLPPKELMKNIFHT